MKTKIIFLLLLVLATMLVISCDDNKTTSSENAQFKTFDDINIPANFNFETNRILDLEFIAPAKGTVIVRGDDRVEYYRTLTDDNNSVLRTISLPKTVKTLDFYYRGMVFSNYSVTSLINNPEVYLFNFDDENVKAGKRKIMRAIIPILEGIVFEADGTITSHWGYNNQLSETIEVAVGEINQFRAYAYNDDDYDSYDDNNDDNFHEVDGYDQNQRQTTVFLPGIHNNEFTVNFDPNVYDYITWTLKGAGRTIHQSASEDSPLLPISDSDGDGVDDDNDNYPNDPNKAYDYFYPSQGNYGTLAFEDLWPNKGDYDFNDLVVRYNIKEVINANDGLVEIHFNLILTAIGASKQNGFYFELPHPAIDVTVIEASHPNLTMKTNNTGLAIIQVFNNTNDLIVLNSDFMNTIQDEPHTEYIPISFVLGIDDKYDNHGSIYYPPYNPFITVDHDRSMEVHLPGLPPTPEADPSYFNNGYNDATDLAAHYYYKTAEGAPWAINVPYPIYHPTETTDIVIAYPDFGKWVQSNGTAFQNWYENPNLEYVYIAPINEK